MSDNANAVGSITVNQAAQSFASMLDSQEGVDTGAEAQPEEGNPNLSLRKWNLRRRKMKQRNLPRK